MRNPPYATRIDPRVSRVAVLVGDWVTAKRLNNIISCAVVLPYEALPSEFDWQFVEARAVLVENCPSESFADIIGTEVMAYGAQSCSVYGAQRLYCATWVNGSLKVEKWYA